MGKKCSTMKTVLFYSSVADKSLFMTQRFYQIDINILESIGYNVQVSNRIFDALKFWQYDFVFAYFFRYSLFVAAIAKCFGKKVYLTGGIDALDKKYVGNKEYRIQRFFFIMCHKIATRCIIVSPSDLKHVEDIVGKNNKKIVLSEHSIDVASLLPSENVIRENNFVTIGWMGSVANIQRKGMDRSIHLFHYLRKYPEFKDSRLLILGQEGEGSAYLKMIIEEMHLDASVKIVGKVSETEKREYLQRNKYYIQLSEYEGFGIAALEALFAGCIVIHSDRGGLSNPIYEAHPLINIDTDLERQIPSLYDSLLHLKDALIERCSEEYAVYYDNSRRKKEIKTIIEEG